MKKVVILVAAGLVFASVAAFAQMRHGAGENTPMPQRNGDTMMPGMTHGGGMHASMMHRNMMAGGMSHGTSSGHPGMQPKGDASPSSLAFYGINMKMHGAMDIAFTGNADADFVRGMIPHHQGAVDMAKTVLAFGKDPEVRKLAEEIVKAQESEVALMNNWLSKNGQ